MSFEEDVAKAHALLQAQAQAEQQAEEELPDAELAAAVAEALVQVRKQNPLVGSITNAVTMEFVANAQLAIGGSAAMVYLGEEGQAMAEMGHALYINMGTLLPLHEEAIPAAARIAHETKTPWVLDPVGIGIGGMRGRILLELAACKPSIIRGNASEIIALASLWAVPMTTGAGEHSRRGLVRGVDSTDQVEDAIAAACALARFTGGAVMISGKQDVVCDAERVVRIFGGSALMSKVTGFGCSLGGVAAVFAGVADPLVAAVAASCSYKKAGTRAATRSSGPGTFKAAFLDALYTLDSGEIAERITAVESVA